MGDRHISISVGSVDRILHYNKHFFCVKDSLTLIGFFYSEITSFIMTTMSSSKDWFLLFTVSFIFVAYLCTNKVELGQTLSLQSITLKQVRNSQRPSPTDSEVSKLSRLWVPFANERD
jgi:hypothetical protein